MMLERMSSFLPILLIVGFCSAATERPKRVAVIGEGVIGLSTATAYLEKVPDAEITVFSDKKFDDILSKNIAGLFRVDDHRYKQYGNETFDRLAKLWREVGGKSGVQLVSGHILSNNPDKLKSQEKNYGDIVYNFRYLERWEMDSQFLGHTGNDSAIHYTAFTSEGAAYCPYMKKELQKKGVKFVLRMINNTDDLGREGFDLVFNCAGLEGGRVAGDDDSVFPIRGVLLHVDAPWQKHFLYRDFATITIPIIHGVVLGTVKQDHNTETETNDDEVAEIMNRYVALQPAMKDVPIIKKFVGFRPGRKTIRVESEERSPEMSDNMPPCKYTVVHNYGHGGNGFTLGWGSAQHAVALALKENVDRYPKL